MNRSTSLRQKITALFIIIFLATLATPAFSSELNQKRNQLNNVNNQLDETRKKIEQKKAEEKEILNQISATDKSIEAVKKEYEQLDGELNNVSSQRNETERQLAIVQAQLYRTQQELEHTEARLEEQKRILNNRIAGIYKQGKSSYVNVLLTSDDFMSLLNRLRFLELIANQDHEIVQEVEETKREIEEKKRQVEADKEAVNTQRVKLVNEEQRVKQLTEAKLSQQKTLESEQNKKKTLLDQVQESREAYEKAEDQLLATSNSIAARIRQLESGSGSGQTYNPNGFVWPTSGRVTSSFGMRLHPIHNVWKMHTGIDIGAPSGQAIVAVQDGTVLSASAGWNGGYGNLTIISHGGGITSLYAHQSSILVSNGQRVSKGQTIGRVGSTGYSTGPHLHFEIRKDGTPQNPMNWY